MVANGMPIFWITINSADLQCPLVIRLTSVEFELSSEIQSAFRHKTATMNPVTVAKFFHIICDTIFISLFDASQTEGGFLGTISNYFGTVETNIRRILHLYCLMWLKGVSYLATLRTQLQSNNEFRQKLLSFLEHII